MKRKLTLLFIVLLIALLTTVPASAGRGNETPGVVYVTSQGLYYDTFVVKDPLPFLKRFWDLFTEQFERKNKGVKI